MVFVTVGTHEQPFNRLVEHMDNMKKNGRIQEEVVIQTGYSTYEPQYCTWARLYPYSSMLKLVEEARIVITHGGPSSFIMALQLGKTPIVVPRQKKYNEHINDHQVTFTNEVARRMGTIITVEDIERLDEVIQNYNELVHGMSGGMHSNNARFNEELGKIVNEMFEGKSRE